MEEVVAKWEALFPSSADVTARRDGFVPTEFSAKVAASLYSHSSGAFAIVQVKTVLDPTALPSNDWQRTKTHTVAPPGKGTGPIWVVIVAMMAMFVATLAALYLVKRHHDRLASRKRTMGGGRTDAGQLRVNRMVDLSATAEERRQPDPVKPAAPRDHIDLGEIAAL